MGPEMLLLVGEERGCWEERVWAGGGAQGGKGAGGGERERGNAPNHDNFSSPQLHC